MKQSPNLALEIENGKEKIEEIQKIVSMTVVGQKETIQQILIGVLTGGHILLVGVPGLAKTLLVKALAAALGWKFRRIQFTPDLMPSDILGGEVMQTDPDTGQKSFKFLQGPIFTNLLLADEINRTPPKTQAALLEAMQEKTVTTGGVSYNLENPFLVVATQNPIEQEGTYPLPEAQLDRFLLSLNIQYPSPEEEEEIADKTSGPESPFPDSTIDIKELLGIARHIPVPPHVTGYAVKLVRATRPDDPSAPKKVKEFVRWGAGPRASQHLLLAAKAHAILSGRFAAIREDVKSMLKAALRHRLVLRFNAVSEGLFSDEVLDAVLDKIEKN